MKKIVFIISLLTLNILYSYSQEQQLILNNAIQSYQKELPKLQKTIFKKFCKLYKQGKVNIKDIGKYQIFVIPKFKLNKDFIQYKEGDMYASYIDFKSMWPSYEGYIFKDNSYIGFLYFDKGFSFFRQSIDSNIAKQIRDFKPDMIFYADDKMLLCCIKDGKFYIAEMIKTSEFVLLTEEEFIKKYPTRIKELSTWGFPARKRYKKIR